MSEKEMIRGIESLEPSGSTAGHTTKITINLDGTDYALSGILQVNVGVGSFINGTIRSTDSFLFKCKGWYINLCIQLDSNEVIFNERVHVSNVSFSDGLDRLRTFEMWFERTK